MSKTTIKHFNIFKQACQQWIKAFGLTGWEIYFAHEQDERAFASIAIKSCERVATFYLNTEWKDDIRMLSEREIRKCAKHETIHLLLTPLEELAMERFTTEREIDAVAEELTNKLVKLIK